MYLMDYLSPISLGTQLEAILDNPPASENIGIVSIEVFIYMKLVTKRRKDQLGIIELVKVGADVQHVITP